MKTMGDLFNLEPKTAPASPVECLGMTFPNDEERRKHFLGMLREKLKDPEFRKIEGFPIGSDEDILALSDPPYYTACPNPFIADFIKHYGKPYDPSKPYSREPFAADVSEGKNDDIYLAHSYHTKVPYKAIIRYILHYTEPGDVVFDGFCGTGMTGVAAQMCGNKTVVESLGYKVEKDGTISQQETDENGKTIWKSFSKIGVRQAVLNDLSPAATFIAHNFNAPVDVNAFELTAKRALKEVEDECGWMYETHHTDGKTKGRINYVVWSDVFTCPECAGEIVFWREAINKTTWQVNDEFSCPHCSTSLSKREMDRAFETIVDKDIGVTIRRAKQVPALIHYFIGRAKYLKEPDEFDFAVLNEIESKGIPYPIPTDRMPEGKESRRNDPVGITHVHHFYTRRNLWALAAFSAKQGSVRNTINVSSVATIITKMYRFRSQSGSLGAGGGPLSGTLYVPSLCKEIPITKVIREHIAKWVPVQRSKKVFLGACVATGSVSGTPMVKPNSIDYIFVDPPFGANLFYSELNFIWESWLKVWTCNKTEAIENSVQNKGLDEYRRLMVACFNETYRVLKPGRWMTVEFSNTKASVWNSIQTALMEAGFIVANVSALDKKQGSFKAVTTPTAVKQDLVISAYKPNGGFEDRFQKEATSEEGAWDFVRTHLKYLPVVKRGASASHLMAVTERDPRILYDQMVAYFIRKGYPVPLNSATFQEGLSQRFSYRDGMYFLPDQVAEYDKRKLTAGGMEQMSLFVSDESSAIAWLRQLLKDKPLSFQNIHPLFIKELGGWQKYEKPLELSELLEQNFLRYDGKGEVPNQIHSYLSTNFKELRNLSKDDESLRAKGKDRWYVPDPNKAGDLEKLRERSLLKEFEDYRTSSQKRLKVFRLEAVRAGFKKAWQEKSNEGYRTIIEVAKKIPENVLQEDPKLLMWYDQALTRSGEE
jgi:DNA modification methylase/predicted RNA-binding Zn-ribbon protein involved in translation (DUF1610 family)